MKKKILAIIMSVVCCLGVSFAGCAAPQAGKDIVSMSVNADGHLMVVYSDSSTPVDLGKVTGSNGNGIASMNIDAEGHLVVTYTNSNTPVDLGKVVGKDGTAPVWYNGTQDPTAAIGDDGDYYIDTNDFLLYVKGSGEWTVLLEKFGGEDTTQYYTNLFNVNDPDTLTKTDLGDDGTTKSVAYACTASHYIPIEVDKQYLFKDQGRASSFGGRYNNVVVYDANKTCLGYLDAGITSYDDGGTPIDPDVAIKNQYDVLNDDTFALTVPSSKFADAKYVRFNILKPTNFMLIEGDTYYFTYVAYGEKAVIPGTESSTDGLTESERKILMQSNPLYGKKIGWEGDSICAGEGFTGGYAGVIASANYMDSTNKGRSGGTIVDGAITASNTQRHSIVDGVQELAANTSYDYVIFEGGVNDVSCDNDYYTMNFGEISSGYTATLDITTFCGAFETCCKSLALSGKKVGYIFVHKIFNDEHKWVTTWRPAIIKMLEKWGIPYLDLEKLVPSLNLIPELKATYTKPNSSGTTGDGWHPNEAGYKTFYVDKITQWLKTL